jgi:two-component system, OmpR family, osmolarity sensor histidine kinase EnvZ
MRLRRSLVSDIAPKGSWRRHAVGWGRTLGKIWAAFGTFLSDIMPKGLYARALIIIIAPIVVLEGVIAFVFMERHWEWVTRRLSEATARDISALIQVYEYDTSKSKHDRLIKLARDKLELSMQVLPPGNLPPPRPKPFFGLLDQALSREISNHVKRPFWIDTVGNSRLVEIRVKHPDAILRFVATRSQTYASNSHIFLLWMVGTSIILLTVAILFLRNQIRPILRLADAAAEFGKGRSIPDGFRPRGAREVREAAEAFLEMSDRITTHVEQRTTMLAGVSHDLRTILTRFKLELAFLDDSPEVDSLKSDINEMQQMLEDYLAFARGDDGEQATPTDLVDLMKEVKSEAKVYSVPVSLKFRHRYKELIVPLKRQAFKRAVTNLVSNAVRYGDKIVIRVAKESGWIRIEINDNGPGIPEAERTAVFKPFYRLNQARTTGDGSTGLGLAIARDIARSHGGDIKLGESSLGGLRAVISIPI